MNNDNDIKQAENAGEQSDTCGLISSPAHDYPASVFIYNQDCLETMAGMADESVAKDAGIDLSN